jgi:tRNA threonylcarbamoyladenosine biosynthesis protein TsaE
LRVAPDQLNFISHSSQQTQRVGATLGKLLKASDIILLSGELGAGKTTFTKGLAEGLGVSGYVNSPTFTLVNEYHGRVPVYHLDCYRLESGREALDFGIEEYLYGDGVTIIEWFERIDAILPAEHLIIRLNHLNETKRDLRFEPSGKRYIDLVNQFKNLAFGISQ